MKNSWYLLALFSLIVFASCEKEEQPYVLAPLDTTATIYPLITANANIGTDYDKQVYFSFATGAKVSQSFSNYDLAFEASPAGYHIYLNSGKFMFACRTGSTNISTADTLGKRWFLDNDHQDDDSLGINNTFHNSSVASEVFVIDRGKYLYPINWGERLRKFVVKEVSDTSYTIIYSKNDNSALDTFIIKKNAAYSLMYFSFDNGGQLVQMAPEKNQWDVVFTRYTHTFYDEPIGSPYRYYLVNGGLNNRWNGITGTIIKDSLPNYIPFTNCTAAEIPNHNFVHNSDVIGYSWKEYDFNNFHYVIVPNKYFVIKVANNIYYKIQFIDFYNPQTTDVGFITFEYQRISN